MAGRRYDAIIFDLFGTLVDNITREIYRTMLRQTAEILGIDIEAFISCWNEEDFRHRRRCGLLPSSVAQMEYVCARFHISPVAKQIDRAVNAQQHDYGLKSLLPRSGTVETLTALKDAGYLLGLISDCSWEVPDVWGQTAFAALFDATIFSCEAGIKKPHPRLYHLACERLGVLPEGCLYVGDGSGRELTGAGQAGMRAVLLCAPYERDFVMQQENPGRWDGPVIERIEDLFSHVL